jgi:hypothetical protein
MIDAAVDSEAGVDVCTVVGVAGAAIGEVTAEGVSVAGGMTDGASVGITVGGAADGASNGSGVRQADRLMSNRSPAAPPARPNFT